MCDVLRPEPICGRSAPHLDIAVAFASALVDGHYDRAHALLAPLLQQQMSPNALHDKLYAMFRGYANGAPRRVRLDERFAMIEWTAKLPEDVGWVYVSIEGDDFVEAVTVTVAEIEGKHLIRKIEWGRP